MLIQLSDGTYVYIRLTPDELQYALDYLSGQSEDQPQ